MISKTGLVLVVDNCANPNPRIPSNLDGANTGPGNFVTSVKVTFWMVKPATYITNKVKF